MEVRIPKIIHYAWFGKNKKNDLTMKCIESWKRAMPDYEYVEWNEENFDLDLFEFTRKAYNEKKYAYVTDVVRLYALYHFGGIYMDTDVEAIKAMDDLLCFHGFSGFQSYDQIPTGTLASEKGNMWIKEQLEYYNTAEFDLEDVNKKLITNVEIITNMSIKKHGLTLNNQLQELKYGMRIYPIDFFCAKDARTGKINITSNTYTIHHFVGSWVPASAKIHRKMMNVIRNVCGEKISHKIYYLYKKKRRK